MKRELSLVSKDPHNKEILLRYYKVRTTEVKLATLVIDFVRLNMMSRILSKKFEESTLEDIEELSFKINQRHSDLNTQNKCRSVLKSFFRWKKGYPRGEFPPEVKWVRLNKVPLLKVKAEDLIPYEECVRISECAKYLRDKALFQCILDAGCRIREILTVKVGEVQFNEAGAILYSDGKTGEQPCILTWSAKTLAQCCVRKAGYTRRVWLHLLKHASSTEDAKNGMSDSFRRYKHHWTRDSRMPAVYEHISQSIIPRIQNETWKALTGQEKVQEAENQQQSVILTKICVRCDFENSRDSLFYNRCGYELDRKKAEQAAIAKGKTEELLNKLVEDPDKLDKFLSLIES